jgi:short-subunit dehydrogenase
LDRNVAAITGASSGIGEVFARKLAPTHDLLLIARRIDRLEALAKECANKYETNAEVLQADLAEEPDVHRIAARIEREPRLALLVNNAGFGIRGRFWEAPFEPQQRMHKLHVMATLELSYAALRNMVPRNYGGIINVSSVSAFVRVPGTVSYAATKTWMNTLTEGIHLELRAIRSKVVVQALCPGYTYSEFHDHVGVKRPQIGSSRMWLTAEEVVDASLEGLGRRKLFVVPGWRYRLLTRFLSALPTPFRLQVETIAGQMRSRQNQIEAGG